MDGAHLDTCSGIFGRNARVHTLTVLCDGAFSSPDFLWLRTWSAIFLPRGPPYLNVVEECRNLLKKAVAQYCHYPLFGGFRWAVSNHLRTARCGMKITASCTGIPGCAWSRSRAAHAARALHPP